MNIINWLKQRNIHVHNEALIRQAFMHSSYANEHRRHHDNERLEFMGDAVLQLWSSERIFKLEPPLAEGRMTTLRAQLVCEKALAGYVRQLKLNSFLLLGSGEEKTGGREKDAIIADMFEAFLGALYLDQGMPAVDNILNEVMVPYLKAPEQVEVIRDYKTKLQEYVQADSRKSIVYETISVEGPNNSPEFEVAVKIDGLTYGYGKGSSKKQAQKNAAKDALRKLVQL